MKVHPLPLGRDHGAAVARAAGCNGYRLERTPTRFGQLYTLYDAVTGRSVTARVYLSDIQAFLRDKGIDA